MFANLPVVETEFVETHSFSKSVDGGAVQYGGLFRTETPCIHQRTYSRVEGASGCMVNLTAGSEHRKEPGRFVNMAGVPVKARDLRIRYVGRERLVPDLKQGIDLLLQVQPRRMQIFYLVCNFAHGDAAQLNHDRIAGWPPRIPDYKQDTEECQWNK